MIYVEYINRDRGLPYEIFVALGDQSGWSSLEDTLVAQLGRTMRLGPEPAYLCLWRCKGFRRLEEWEAWFRSEAYLRDRRTRASLHAVHISAAGCYDELVTGAPVGEGLQYIEFVPLDDAVADATVADHFRTRAAAHPNAVLNVVLRRIGVLGPEPSCLALWTFPDYESHEAIARERHAPEWRPTRTGVYRRFGEEIL
jgi:hypothetical protein